MPCAAFRSRIISIHALREEGDSALQIRHTIPLVFLSTPSVRRATFKKFRDRHFHKISIHALREEGDGHWAVPSR